MHYKQAAESARNAGDGPLEQWILREASAMSLPEESASPSQAAAPGPNIGAAIALAEPVPFPSSSDLAKMAALPPAPNVVRDDAWCEMASKNIALKDTATYYEACVGKGIPDASSSRTDKAWRCKEINGVSYGAAHCKATNKLLADARRLIRQSPEQAAELYRQAMESAKKAGDFEMESAIRTEAEAAAAWAAAAASDTPDQAYEAAGSCVSYFDRMRKEMSKNAGLCLKNAKLMQSTTVMLMESVSEDENIIISTTKITEAITDPTFTRSSAPDFVATVDGFEPDDPRWTKSADGNLVSANCEVPSTVQAQNESYIECWRVYACGERAARCGIEMARRTNAKQCAPISAVCLAQNPIPQMGISVERPKDAMRLPREILPRHRDSQSTITGPSPPGSGDSGGAVVPAR